MVALGRRSSFVVRRSCFVAAGAWAAAAVLAAPAAGAAPDDRAGCAPAKAPGGQWRSYGHDDSNTRSQPREDLISAQNVAGLRAKWVFSVADAGGEGDIAGTPVVRFGCVYVATSRGWVIAFNADTGEPVWARDVPDRGFVYSSVGVTRKRVYVSVNRTTQGLTGCPQDEPCLGPFVMALDRKTGKRDWVSRPIDTQRGSETYASPVIVGGVVLVGVSGGVAELSADESLRENFQGSLVFLNGRNGRIVEKTWTIHPPGDPDDDFSGAGVWGTPAIDRRAKLAYVGTANPYVPAAAHPHAGAVLKLDVNRRHKRRFGDILAFGEGTPEEYLEAFSDLPCIDFPGNVPPYPTGLGSCFDLDLDFGASPNLFRGPDGRELVGAGQKSGVYHVFDAKTMEPVWNATVGPPGYFGGIVGSTAYDGDAIYGPITIPGYLWSIDADGGSLRWVAPILDVLHWGPPVAVANGVLYSVDWNGYLNAVDAASGVVLLKAPLRVGEDGGFRGTPSWAGVSVARHTVYAAVGTGGSDDGAVIAFGLG
ncbi:MAG: PQQ-binding-like beta-propeller repeat protein [Solirubrobacterales bacterium]